MASLFQNARVSGKLCDFVIEDGRFTAIAEPGSFGQSGIDLGGKTVIPGFIDIHTHGALGHEAAEPEYLSLIADYQAAHGTTTFYPTTGTIGYEQIKNAVSVNPHDVKGARVGGFHLEGPFLSLRYKGAQDPEYLKNPDFDFLDSLPNVACVTIAPELPNAEDFIRRATAKGIHIAIGHTEADYETAMRAIAAGADNLTHTCNAMSPLLHRAPGPIGAGAEAGIYAQVIADGVHIHKAMVIALSRMFGKDKTVFISDAISPAGVPDGEYESNGMAIIVKNREARLPNGTLAGSTSMLLDCARKALSFGFSLDDVVLFTSTNAARLMGLPRGQIAVGYDADFLVTEEDLSHLYHVYIGGEEYRADYQSDRI